MISKNAVLLGIGGIFLGVLFIGQGPGLAQTQPTTLKLVPVSYSHPNSGKIMFKDYCAACHGMNGKGNGPAVIFLKTPPPDLTTMATRYKEKSVERTVRAALKFGTESKAHGTVNMPLWGPIFNAMPASDQGIVQMRLDNLSQYIESIQKR